MQELVAAQQPPGPETIAERHARLLRTASDLCDRVRATERVQWRRLCREEIAALLAHCRKESGELSERGDKAEENARYGRGSPLENPQTIDYSVMGKTPVCRVIESRHGLGMGTV